MQKKTPKKVKRAPVTQRCWKESCRKALTKKEIAEYGGACAQCYWDSRVSH